MAVTRSDGDCLVGDLDEAFDQVARGGFEFAVVDINLRGREAFSVADELKRKRLPFIFATGYGAPVIPDRFVDVRKF
jgi:DNA-binding response OmpR family regulator